VQPISPDEFEDLVAEALDSLPPEVTARFRNVAVVVEHENDVDQNLLGLYEGVPLTERDNYGGVLPDRITLYRIPLCLHSEDLGDLVREIAITVVHEFGHHMGMSEGHLHDLGWG